MKPALISNAQSLYNKTQLHMISECATRLNVAHHILDAATLSTPARIDAQLAQARVAATDTLIINGGDGTLDLILTRLRGEMFTDWQPDILLLRGGTTNMTHGDVGYGHDPARALVNALRADKPLTTTTRHLIKLSGGNMPAPHYGFFFGTHAITRAIHTTHAKHHAHGRTNGTGEAMVFANALFNLLCGRVETHAMLRPTLLQYTRGGITQQAQHVCLVATTLHKHVLGMRLSEPENSMGCLLLQTPVESIWRHIPSLWRGAPMRDSGCLLRWRDTAITLEFSGEVTLDGELFSCDSNAPMTVALDVPVRFLQ